MDYVFPIVGSKDKCPTPGQVTSVVNLGFCRLPLLSPGNLGSPLLWLGPASLPSGDALRLPWESQEICLALCQPYGD